MVQVYGPATPGDHPVSDFTRAIEPALHQQAEDAAGLVEGAKREADVLAHSHCRGRGHRRGRQIAGPAVAFSVQQCRQLIAEMDRPVAAEEVDVQAVMDLDRNLRAASPERRR